MNASQRHALTIAARDDLLKYIDDRGSLRQRCNSRGLESLLMQKVRQCIGNKLQIGLLLNIGDMTSKCGSI